MSYKYSPLNSAAHQVRVLKLEHAQNERADIRCTLKTISILRNTRSREQYEALSYTWGPPEPKTKIWLNGSPFEITENLELAFRRLRQGSTPRTLWIDAICIDQSNIQERTQQVNLMRHIYANAHRVLVWLGESDRDINKAIKFIADLKFLPETLEEDTPAFYAPVSRGLVKLFSKPWWFRIWVVQEVILTQAEILAGCGRCWLPFSKLVEVLREIILVKQVDSGPSGSEFLKDLPHDKSMSLIRFMDFTMLCQDSSKPVYLEDVLWYTRGRGATDPRDQVFGLLGLVSDDEHGAFLPDYEKSVEKVYQDAMVRAFQSSKNLCLLISAPTMRTLELLPSWCVDFSAASLGISERQISRVNFDRPIIDDAFPDIVHDAQKGTLTVPGTLLGRITRSENCTAPHASEEVIEFLQDMLSFERDSIIALSLRLGRPKAAETFEKGGLWKTILAGLPFFEAEGLEGESCGQKPTTRRCDPSNPSDPDFFSDFALFEDWVLQSIFADEPATPESLWVTSMLGLMGYVMNDKALLLTDFGFMANADRHVELGDVLCFLDGCTSPAVLRPEADGSFRLVTFAWVYDVSPDEKDTTELAFVEPPVNQLAQVQAKIGELVRGERLEQRSFCLR